MYKVDLYTRQESWFLQRPCTGTDASEKKNRQLPGAIPVNGPINYEDNTDAQSRT